MVTDDWELIRRLRRRYLVTLMERVELLAQQDDLENTHLLVLDCSRSAKLALDCLVRLKEAYPDLCVLLVDGGLSQTQIAAAFRDGVKDYFASPYDVKLLVERLNSLCARLAPRKNSHPN